MLASWVWVTGFYVLLGCGLVAFIYLHLFPCWVLVLLNSAASATKALANTTELFKLFESGTLRDGI